MFFDQFSIVEYLRYASSFTYNSTHPACKFTLLYLGAEQPSIIGYPVNRRYTNTKAIVLTS